MSSIRVLRTFAAVAAEGSFAAAAARVALTQAAVGQQMRALEADLRRPLFERQGKTVVLNEAGRELVPQVRRLLALYEQMLAPAAAPEAMAGTVHLGAIVSAVRPLIQATIALKSRHPGLDLHVSAAKSIDLVASVQAGALDAAVVVREPAASGEVAWTPLYAEPMVLLAPRRLEEAQAREILQSQPFIRFDPAQHTGLLVARTLARLRVKPQEFLELNALESIVELVRSGLGVSVVPLLHDARWQADARLRVLEIPRAEERRIALVQRRDAANARVIAAVVRELRKGA
ncbi:MAG TPA: LysR substrate-binding domain-containing protein [Ramlibacter sp.]|uniref:LysR substrate-binding domain-containing protein n=1 Tax=Ramlibacter sp. TaxID=1917967 RepID=UPI002D809A1B|nr:LysR substrate-binding domain-containing protein [Ramlibacter sp.]HET8748683.1 LysR substrate-binding domain-containing protein [Ramlibacter sp.]